MALLNKQAVIYALKRQTEVYLNQAGYKLNGYYYSIGLKMEFVCDRCNHNFQKVPPAVIVLLPQTPSTAP